MIGKEDSPKKIGILLFKQKELMAGQANPRNDFHKEENMAVVKRPHIKGEKRMGRFAWAETLKERFPKREKMG